MSGPEIGWRDVSNSLGMFVCDVMTLVCLVVGITKSNVVILVLTFPFIILSRQFLKLVKESQVQAKK